MRPTSRRTSRSYLPTTLKYFPAQWEIIWDTPLIIGTHVRPPRESPRIPEELAYSSWLPLVERQSGRRARVMNFRTMTINVPVCPRTRARPGAIKASMRLREGCRREKTNKSGYYELIAPSRPTPLAQSSYGLPAALISTFAEMFLIAVYLKSFTEYQFSLIFINIAFNYSQFKKHMQRSPR